ncbi:MAG TPA: endonuclease domain-containing protein [Chloroflexota bacterium]|nr:endonuclease domain-containing protein [Chloroflexota bacterium]
MSVSEDAKRVAHEVWRREAARALRRGATPTEQRLWAVLRGRRFGGRRFRRQHTIRPYIVDFLCAEARLVIEIDGLIHESQQEYDAERDDFLREQGYRVLRIRADQICRDLAAALAQIDQACKVAPVVPNGSTTDIWPPPLPCAGEGVGG